MYKILTQNQIAEALKISKAAVSKAVKLKLIILNSDKKVNLTDKINNDWIKKQETKGRFLDFNIIARIDAAPVGRPKGTAKPKDDTEPKQKKPRQPRQPKPKTPEVVEQTEIETADDTLNEKKVKTEIEWKQSQIRLNQIKEEKQKGDLMPTDSVMTLFNYAAEAVRASYLQEVRNVAEVFRQTAGLNHVEFIDMQKQLTIAVNNVTMVFKKTLAEGVDDIVNEYKEVRSRGEGK